DGEFCDKRAPRVVGFGGCCVGRQFTLGELPQFGEFAVLSGGEARLLATKTDDPVNAGRCGAALCFFSEDAGEGTIEGTWVEIGVEVDRFDERLCLHVSTEPRTTDIATAGTLCSHGAAND